MATCARRLTTLFIHDHRPEFTAANVYKGLFMMVRAYDQDDTGDETRGFRLPYGDHGEYDVPLLFQDKRVNPPTGELTFNQFATDGFLGDLITVNGKYPAVHEGQAAPLPLPAAQRRAVPVLQPRPAQARHQAEHQVHADRQERQPAGGARRT